MARIRFNDTEYDLPDSDTWTIGELSEAEHAFGRSFGDESQGDSMAIAFFIAVRRIDKEIPTVVLADAIRALPISALLASAEDADDVPLDSTEPTDHDDPPTIGPRRLEASA